MNACVLCHMQLPRLANGQRYFVLRDGRRAHVACPDLDRLAATDETPAGVVSAPVSQEDGS